MRKIALIAALVSSPALAGDIDLQIDNFAVDRGITSLVLKVTNNSDANVGSIYATCAFLNEDKRALRVQSTFIAGVAAGQSAYSELRTRTGGIKNASCTIDGYESALR